MTKRHSFKQGMALLFMLAPLVTTATTFEYKLNNGLKVIVKEDHRAPVVVAQIWYRAGGMDEVTGTTGVAHVLEHMMFKGTKKLPGGKFSQLIAAAGGRENAFTNRDYTAYFQQLHKSKLPLSFELEADRMQNLVLNDAEFAKEIKVVMEERRLRTEDQPQALVYEQMVATAYQAHPYRVPVIGWMNDLENMKSADAKRWYDTWYTPGNAVLVVVGDVNPNEVYQLAKRYYGKVKARDIASRKSYEEPPQRGIKRVTVKAPAKLSYLLMAYHAPVLQKPLEEWEPYALEMLSGVLDGNASARLTKALVRESQIASDVGVGYDLVSRGPGMFLIDGTPSEGKTVAELETAIRAELEKLKTHGVSEEELQRIKAQVIAADVYQRDSMFYQAMQIGELEVSGLSHKILEIRLEKLKAITPLQVQAVAKKYLLDDKLTVAVLDPQPLDETKISAPPKAISHGR